MQTALTILTLLIPTVGSIFVAYISKNVSKINTAVNQKPAGEPTIATQVSWIYDITKDTRDRVAGMDGRIQQLEEESGHNNSGSSIN